MNIVEVRNLQYTYPNASVPALRGLDVTVEEGEFILLTGPSGCGKTTFCRCLNGLIPHFYSGEFDGDIVVNGLLTRDHPTTELAQHVGLIFQNPDNQIFALTVEKDVAFGLENLGVEKTMMKEAVDWALGVTGISDLRYRATHELSGGQKQRLAIASILAMRPRIIVLDEPTSFLDPVGAERIFEVLQKLNRDYRITVILIEHRMDLAVRHVDRVIVFKDGKIVKDGTPGDVFTSEDTRLTGVGVPKIVELCMLLSRRGIVLKGIPLTSESLVEDIKAQFSKAEVIQKEDHTLPELTGLIETQQSKPIIEVDGISYSYPSGVEALRDVSIKIHQGEFVAIMGENGAGKTTLVKHFNGLLKPQKGRVVVDGVDVSKVSVASLARKVGLVFQNPDDQLFSESVEEEISFALRNFGFEDEVIVKRVEWALNLLDIERYRESSPFILSGGERKRTALASVLAWDPEVFVLDEPTIGQDYAQKERLRHFLMQLRSQGKTPIIVTHDVEFVAECRPRIVLMSDGKIISDGPTNRIMTDMDALKRASVSPPEITKLFSKLTKYGFPPNVVEVEEAADLLYRRLWRAEH